MVRRRFREGVSLTGREARMVFADLVLAMWLPQPLHQLALSYCHLVYLVYATEDTLVTDLWRAVGKLHTLLPWLCGFKSPIFVYFLCSEGLVPFVSCCCVVVN